MNCRVLHVVRRFGPVGGMERYVWRLTSELLELGVEIDILCQSIECDVDPRITVHQLAPSTDRRRWKAMRDFRDKCDKFWLEFEAKDDVIVHSHERCRFHHVTTFHGPPMPAWNQMVWYKRMSTRVAAWKRFEIAEVLGPNVRLVVPVSRYISRRLALGYADISDRLMPPGWPGLNPGQLQTNRGEGYRVLFVGREWKRKGLDIAIQAFAKVRCDIPFATLDVYGVAASQIPSRLRRLSRNVNFHDWQSAVPFQKYDILIHPARDEPFGMIIPEARAAGLNVVTSNMVGAVELMLSGIDVLDYRAGIDTWAQALRRSLLSSKVQSELTWTWSDLAAWHAEAVYPTIAKCKIELHRDFNRVRG